MLSVLACTCVEKQHWKDKADTNGSGNLLRRARPEETGREGRRYSRVYLQLLKFAPYECIASSKK